MRVMPLVFGAVCACVVLAGPSITTAGASPAPEIGPSTHVIVPGTPFVVTGSGWPDGTTLDVTICGADAVEGTADCAVTTTADMVATAKGIVWAQLSGAIPPQPCPCVLLVTGPTNGYTKTIPIQVVGARTAPVPPAPLSSPPALRVFDLRVLGRTTLGSSLGGPARRTLEMRIDNPEHQPVTVALVARWGSGGKLRNAIDMPMLKTLGAGQSEEVTAGFALGAFAVGSFRVRVAVELVGYSHEIVLSSATSQWPLALFGCALVLLLLLAFLAVLGVRAFAARGARRGAGEGEV